MNSTNLISTIPLLQVQDLKTYFPVTGGFLRRITGYVKAVNQVSLVVYPQQMVAVVGESGCGKSTLGQSILGLIRPTAGQIWMHQKELLIQNPKSWTPFRKDFQIIFQDPYSSLNPRHTIYEIISEPLVTHRQCLKSELRDRVVFLLEKVGLNADAMHRYPHEFSGGQRQRINIARVIGIRPQLIICDEMVASLDVSVQAQILELLLQLKRDFELALLFISHDLTLVQAVTDWVHVMYLGKIVESGPVEQVFGSPLHPYTQALLEAIPTFDRKRKPKPLEGSVPSPVNLPPGCAFASRCSRAQAQCMTAIPPLLSSEHHSVACFFPLH